MKKLFRRRLIDHKYYWKIRALISAYKLKYRSRKFFLKNNIKSEMANAYALYATLASTIKTVAVAIIITALLHLADKYAAPVLALSGWKVPNESDYVTFLACVAGIGGVFIGLYYAALTSVGSAIYAKVPNNIRELLVKERSGNAYMRFLSILTLLCILLIACKISGSSAVISAIPFIALLSGAGIIAFVKLGRTAFNLFDPTALAHHIFEDLNKAIATTMPGGVHWGDPAFQNHAYLSASKSIETLRLLLEITIKETHQNGQPLSQLSLQILNFLSFYNYCKLKIPSNSNWHPQQFKHKDWYATPGHSVMIAHKTGTALQPEVTKSKDWIERKLHSDLLRILEINIEQGRHIELSRLIGRMDHYIGILTYNGSLDMALGLTEEISNTFIRSCAEQTTNPTTLSAIEKLSTLDHIAALPITIALTLNQHVESYNIENITTILSNIDWQSKPTIYESGLPLYLTPSGEWLADKLSNEFQTEGKIVSATWYQKDIINLALTRELANQISSFPKRSIAFFSNLSLNFSQDENSWLKASIQSREHEFWHKAERTFEILIESWGLSEKSRALSDLPWATIRQDEIEAAILARKKELQSSIADQTLRLSTITPEGFPDYAGQFLFITGQSFFEAICKNDEALSSLIFQKFMLGSVARFEKLKPATGTVIGLEEGYRIAAASLLDLIELSGYALLLSEFHQNKKIWQPIKDTWTKLFDEKYGETIKAYIALVIQLNSNGFGLPLRGELRFNWEGAIWTQIKNTPFEISEHGFNDYKFKHPSALIRSIDPNDYGRLPSGFNLFIAYWYIEKIKPKDFEMSWEQKALYKIAQNQTEEQR